MDATGQWLEKVEPSPVVTTPTSEPMAKVVTFEAGPDNEEHGAPVRYEITGLNLSTNPEHVEGEPTDGCTILFQNGVVPEVGFNGVTPEVLLDILIHRFQKFQSGKLACSENERALEGLRQAKQAIIDRRADRLERHVHNTYEA